MRPVCQASEANNGQLSGLLATVVNGIVDLADKDVALCRSTEEMIASLEEVNSKELDNICIFSTDVSAMFPSLEIPSVARIAAEEYTNSTLDVNINEEELSLYLAVVKTRAELVSMGLGDVTHTRKATRGAAPGITTEEILDRTGKTVSKFHKPVRPPTSDEKRKMFATALEVLINQAMENHCYTFNGEIKQQSKGGGNREYFNGIFRGSNNGEVYKRT